MLGGSATTSRAQDRRHPRGTASERGDIKFSDGTFRVVGDRAVSLQDTAQAAYVPSRLPPGLETGLYEVASFSPEIPNLPNGCHVCEIKIEIDPETGATAILRHVVVDDRHCDQQADARRADP